MEYNPLPNKNKCRTMVCSFPVAVITLGIIFRSSRGGWSVSAVAALSMVRIRVRANGSTAGAAVKIGAEAGVVTTAQLVEKAAALLLAPEQRGSMDAAAARLYLDGGDEVATIDMLDKDDVVYVAFDGEPFQVKVARVDGYLTPTPVPPSMPAEVVVVPPPPLPARDTQQPSTASDAVALPKAVLPMVTPPPPPARDTQQPSTASDAVALPKAVLPMVVPSAAASATPGSTLSGVPKFPALSSDDEAMPDARPSPPLRIAVEEMVLASGGMLCGRMCGWTGPSQGATTDGFGCAQRVDPPLWRCRGRQVPCCAGGCAGGRYPPEGLPRMGSDVRRGLTLPPCMTLPQVTTDRSDRLKTLPLLPRMAVRCM